MIVADLFVATAFLLVRRFSSPQPEAEIDFKKSAMHPQ
jgi:hypothetical protein